MLEPAVRDSWQDEQEPTHVTNAPLKATLTQYVCVRMMCVYIVCVHILCVHIREVSKCCDCAHCKEQETEGEMNFLKVSPITTHTPTHPYT